MASASPKRKSAPGRAPVSKAVLKDFLSGVIELAGPVLDEMGLELIQAQCPLEGGQPVLRLFIDKAAAAGPGGGISLEDCAAFSRALDAVLENTHYDSPELENYLMEVSSPGLDRPLLKASDYERFQGSLLKLKLRRDGKNIALKGRLGRTAEGALALQTPDEQIGFNFDEVISGRLSLDGIFVSNSQE